MLNNYFIKENYRASDKIETLESKNKIYWTKHRIEQSYIDQYSTYKFCKKLVKKKKINNILDIGCGPASKLMKLIYPICKEIYGIDQKRIINYCKKGYKLNNFFVDDIENPTFPLKKKFDLVICADVIEHLLNPDKLISYIKNYTNQDSYIVLSTPERDLLRGKDCQFSPKKEHVREWNTIEFIRYLKYNNLQINMHKIVNSYKKIKINLRYSIKKIKIDFMDLLLILLRKKNIKTCQLVSCKIGKS
ncbi:MAG: class I SAM-dependent methyltransferase [Promethearchaeota archaeon]